MQTAIAFTPVARDVLVGTAVVWGVAELRQSLNNRPEASRWDRGSRFVIRIGSIVGVVGAIVAVKAAQFATFRSPKVIDWVGLGVLWCGMGLRLWSFHTLGRYFTFTVQTSTDQPVITTGPYRVIRHPSYAGVLLAVVGIGCLFANWLALGVLVVALFCAIVYRIHVEERALLHDIGEAYRSYAATHKRLIPFIW